MSQFERSELLFGVDSTEKLKAATVAVFGLGGVGSYVTEALARAGIGHLVLVDNDTVSESNLNRQLFALHSTLGQKKTEVATLRVRDIHPDIRVTTWNLFFDESTLPNFDFSSYSYVVDAIDTVGSKILLAQRCYEAGVPEICCLGTGNKREPSRFCVEDLAKTSVCPLARVMRRELKQRGIPHLPVVYSEEEPAHVCLSENGRHIPGSCSFVPPVAGMILAGEVVKNLLKNP